MVQPRTAVNVGGVVLSSTDNIAIQSMFKKPLISYSEDDLRYFYNSGCDLMRFSPHSETDDFLSRFIKSSPFPLIADIQGNEAEAMQAIRCGSSAIRINPGNFSKKKLKDIVLSCKDHNAAIRIGINTASISSSKDVILVIGDYIDFLESLNFNKIVISIKSSNPNETFNLNLKAAKQFNYPFHVGLTEAGFGVLSAVRSTVFFEKILNCGIASTIRYSISGPEEDEIRAARELLLSHNMLSYNFSLISCPMCSRSNIDTSQFSKKIEQFIFNSFDVRKINLKLAIMACPINGIKEAKGADIAVCASDKYMLIYENSSLVEKTQADNVFAVLSNLLKLRLTS